MELFTPGHLLVVAVVALVLFFGWKQLPDMSRSLGRSLRILKTEVKGMSADDDARSDAAAPKEIAPVADQQPQAAVPMAKAAPVARPVAQPVARPVAQSPARPAAQPAAAGAGSRPRPAPRPGHRPAPAPARTGTSAGSDR